MNLHDKTFSPVVELCQGALSISLELTISNSNELPSDIFATKSNKMPLCTYLSNHWLDCILQCSYQSVLRAVLFQLWSLSPVPGLGTSTSKEAKEYFSDMARHRVPFKYAGAEDDASIVLVSSHVFGFRIIHRPAQHCKVNKVLYI